MSAQVSVVIPTLNADQELDHLLTLLEGQSLKPAEILVVDSSSEDDTVAVAQRHRVKAHVINRADFNHGATRHMAFGMTSSPYVVFMTQDAVPADDRLLENLVAPMENDTSIAAVSGRQLPKADARRFEQLVRGFNYPEEGSVRGSADVERYGIKTFCITDVCAAYRRTAYYEAGGFPTTETNEDMLIAARFIANGSRIAYEPAACVYHSHNFTPKQQYDRNRLVGRFLALNDAEFMHISAYGEGGRMVKSVSKQLIKEGRIGELFSFGIDCAARLAGNRAGKRSASRIKEGRS